METLPVTLIVKAPNQQIEDQTIECELSWTIQKLKQHLSEVYPSKPPKHEQKLIYSGQLLSDTVTLKDVLRHYDGQETHTLHLVCTPKYSTARNNTKGKTQMKPQNRTETTSNVASSDDVQNNSQESATVGENNEQNNSQEFQQIPWFYWNNVNVNQTGNVNPNQFVYQQWMMMQQAYMQYMTQYMQLAANANINVDPMPQEATQPQPQNLQQQQNEQPAAAPAEPQQNVNNNQNQRQDIENPDRDWLDVFYILSRALVLFSVVYFYSSPLRFIMVLFLGVGMYLYQIGFFRNMNNNNNNNNGIQDPQVPEEEQAPSRFMVVWTFFATFFASLIPEIPNAV